MSEVDNALHNFCFLSLAIFLANDELNSIKKEIDEFDTGHTGGDFFSPEVHTQTLGLLDRYLKIQEELADMNYRYKEYEPTVISVLSLFKNKHILYSLDIGESKPQQFKLRMEGDKPAITFLSLTQGVAQWPSLHSLVQSGKPN